jgi:phage N-6-adenine-methyltransferase
MNNDLMFSSKTDVWSTPIDFFQALDKVFHFTTDVAALPENAKCAHYYTPEMDGLKQEWTGVCWMNPPYGKTIGQWIAKAYQSSREGATVVCLIPARTDTRYWQDYCLNAEVYFVRGRLKFGNAESCAPFPSAVVCFRPKIADAFTTNQPTLFDDD